jgi:hypothetical protein
MKIFKANKHWLAFAVIFLLAVQNGNAQDIWVGIAFKGDMQGESVSGAGEFGDFILSGSGYIGFGVEDSTSFRKIMRNAVFKIKTQDSLAYKRIALDIPPGFGKHLVFMRDKSLLNGKYFTSYWTDVYPFEHFDKEMHEPFRKDTADHKLYVPKLTIQVNNEPLTARLLKRLRPVPGRLITFTFNLESALVPDTLVEFEKVQIIFAKGTAPLTVMCGDQSSATINWPSAFKFDEGYRIVFNVRYAYKRGNEILEECVMSTNVAFKAERKF